MVAPGSYDVLVLGATGFTGRLVTRYLFAHHERSSFKFAIAARSKSKLEALISELSLDDTVGVLSVDVTNYEQVEGVVKTAKVVINVVGPYWTWGTPVVRACAKNGVHYVDLTGETPWIKDIIEEFDTQCTKTGSIVIPSSGFDSMPSDLSVFISNKTLKEVAGPDALINESVSAFKFKGGFSGGTIASLITSLEQVPKEKTKAASVPYATSPVKGVAVPTFKLIYQLPKLVPLIVGGFFFMSPTNKALVQRTWGLHEVEVRRLNSKSASHGEEDHAEDLRLARSLAYGPLFKYDEFMVTGSKAAAFLISSALAIFAVILSITPFRWLFKNLAPQPGEGPSEEVMQNGFTKITNVTTSIPSTDVPQISVKTVIRGRGDPGYLLTSVMISESALCIALSYDKLPALAHRGGLLTPASALGDVLIDRLKASGRFEFESGVLDEGGSEVKKTR